MVGDDDESRAGEAYPRVYWHTRVTLHARGAQKENPSAIENDLSFEDVSRRIVEPWHANRRFVVGGMVVVSTAEVVSILVTQTAEPLASFKAADQHREKVLILQNAQRRAVGMIVPSDSGYTALNAGKDYTAE